MIDQKAPGRLTPEEEVNTLQLLLNGEGWKQVDAFLAMQEMTAYDLMVKESNPHAAAKHMGAYHAIKTMRAYPQLRIESIRYMLEQDEKRRKLDRRAVTRAG